MRIPLSAPDISEAEIESVVRVLRGRQLSLGPALATFEKTVANYLGVPHAVALNSGTSALHLCVRGLEIREADEVILPSFTFIAVANAVRYERATPVFVDIEPRTLNLDANKIEAAITPRTRAIIAVHTFGVPAEMDAIIDIAQRHNLFVIEDACEAIGAEYHGQKVGSIGHAGALAFYPNKQITTGEGGMLITRNPALATRVEALRNHGRIADNPRHRELGYNYRISDINCALGIAQMGRIDEILARRAEVARKYDAQLRGLPELVLPPLELPGIEISWFVYLVRLADRFTEADRDRLVLALGHRGIATGKYFAPIHRQHVYRNFEIRHPLPITEQVSTRTLALPFFNRISDDEIAEVCQTLARSLQEVARS